MKNLRLGLVACAMAAALAGVARDNAPRRVIDLAGQWEFMTLSKGGADEWVTLPGTTDTNGKGMPNDRHDETTQLTRRHTYTGPAYYMREVGIPADWRDKNITLTLERSRPSTVWVDNRRVGSCRLLSTPHRYDLSEFLTPGTHILKVMVDNGDSIPDAIKSSSHECTESTQTNWNGIIGRIELEARDRLHVKSLQVYPDAATRTFKVAVDLSEGKRLKGRKLTVSSGDKSVTLPLRNGTTRYTATLAMGDTARLWSEWSPALHTVTAALDRGGDSKSVRTGLRNFTAKGRHVAINDTVTFLRGRHDACVWPLTGHVAMNVDEWRRYFRTIKDYGLNHVRFHSWCPPEACFEAADIEGIYLQPELPIWGSFSSDRPELMAMLRADGDRIQQEYGNHPSFVMFALGNELRGEIPVMASFVDGFRSADPRHLYAFGSNIFLGYQGPQQGEDFMVTCRVGGGDGYSTHSRASFSFADADEGGYLNNTYPNTVMNFEDAVERSPIPIIGHETGQYQIYPDFDEMAKYTGVLRPDNFAEFKRRLEAAGMADQADDFHRASGAWAAQLYRADMEMNLRTPQMAGFQLLDLQDYPGQGTALVGVLDAFMDSKGVITPEEWRRSCDEVVLMAELPRYTYTAGDTLSAGVAVANYSPRSLGGEILRWTLRQGGDVVDSGSIELPDGRQLVEAGSIVSVLPADGDARRMDLVLELQGRGIVNSYPVWVYPQGGADLDGITMATSLTPEVRAALRNGARVLLTPARETVDSTTVGGLFMTDYWNYRMFKTISEGNNRPVSPGTLGILVDPSHKAMASFPTDSHTSWQWYPIVKNSYPIILDSLPEGYRPVVQVIDNIERNHRLGLVSEFEVDGGRVLLVMADLDAASVHPEGRQFVKSLADYMRSPDFAPEIKLTADQLNELLTRPAASARIGSLHNISYD